LKTGQPEMLCELVTDEKGDTLRIEDLGSGSAKTVATATGLPPGSDYTVGNFRGLALRDFVIYKPGGSKISARPVEEPSAGRFQIGAGITFDLGQPIMRVITLQEPAPGRLFVIFGDGQKAGIYDFNGTKAPALVQS